MVVVFGLKVNIVSACIQHSWFLGLLTQLDNVLITIPFWETNLKQDYVVQSELNQDNHYEI